MSAKTYVNILKYGLFASFLSFLLLFSSLLFPYITSKQITFNILIEILMVFWVLLIVKYPEYRPKKNLITYGLIAYFLVILASAVVGVDFNLSFWGNAERMLGFFHLIHYFFFYLILVTVMRTPRDWKIILNVSVAIAVLTTIIGLAKSYPASNIGNTAYVAGIMIFNIFFAVWLYALTKDWGARAWYIIALIFLLIGFVRSDISGAQAGLVFGLFFFGFLFAILHKNKKVKIIGWSATGLFVLIIALLFAFRSSPALNGTFLGKELRDFSTANITLNTRLLSWTSAYLDFKNHPILGTGYGNYASTFDKYFNPKFYDYSKNETYFDRAHNNLVDITSTTGILGLLAYLSIFAALGYYLISAYKKQKISVFTFAWLSGLIAAYFVQNLAVFDSLVTYISLFVTLGLVYYLTKLEDEHINMPPKTIASFTAGKEFAALVILAVVFGSVVYYYNIRGFKMLSGVIAGYSQVVHGQIVDGMNTYKATLADAVPYNRDSRSSFVNLISGGSQSLSSLSETDRQDVLSYAVELAKENTDYNYHDSLMEMQLAEITNVASRFNYKNMDKFNDYSGTSLASINYALEASPGRLPLYFLKADIQLSRGENADAVATMKTAIGLKDNFPDSHCQAASIYYFLKTNMADYKNSDDAYIEAGKCADLGGITMLTSTGLINETIKYETAQNNTGTAAILQKALDDLSAQAAQAAQQSQSTGQSSQ